MMQSAFGHYLLYFKFCAAQPFTLKVMRARMLKDGTEDEANCFKGLYCIFQEEMVGTVMMFHSSAVCFTTFWKHLTNSSLLA